MPVNIHCWNGPSDSTYLDYYSGRIPMWNLRSISEIEGIRLPRLDFKSNPNLVKLAVL